jgi:predicted nucleotidyltransferase
MNIRNIQTAIDPILRNFGIIRAAYFGSIVNKEVVNDSDIDILVEFEQGKGLLDLAWLELELGNMLGRKVAIVTYDSLHPSLREKILNEQVVIL